MEFIQSALTVPTQRETPAVAREIIDQSMSPFCPGLSLSACPSPSADSLRDDIIARALAGESKTAILDHLYDDFGSAIRGAPEFAGSGVIAWVMPGIIFVLGAFLLSRWLRRQTRANVTASKLVADAIPTRPDPCASFSDDERRRLESLLRNDPA